MSKNWIKIVMYNSYGDLILSIGGIRYKWENLSMQTMEWLDSDLRKGYNRGRILEKLEKQYGKGIKEG